MGDQDAKKFKTIRKADLLKNWLVASAVNIPANDSSNEHDDASYIAQQAQARIKAHGALKEILSKRTLRSGKVIYDVKWNDGTRTQEGIRMLREVDLDMLMGFHEPPDLENSSSSSSSGSVYQERTLMRKSIVQDSNSDIGSLELLSTTDEQESAEDDQPIRRRIRPIPTRKSQRSSIEEKTTRHFDLTVRPVTRHGPMAAIRFYTNQAFVERHWIDCLKCKQKGYPNGPPDNGKKKRSANQRQPTDDLFEMTPEEEATILGRLLLCITCTAAVHEGCLSAPQKRFLRDCIENDKECTEFQCALCLSVVANKADCIPACDGCHQVHNIADLKLLPKPKINIASPSSSSEPPLNDKDSPAAIATPPDTIDDHPTDFNGLFRCSVCRRAFHDNCIPAVPDANMFESDNSLKGADQQTIIQMCLEQQKCTDCIYFNKKVEKIVTWRIAGEPADKRYDITFNDAAKETKEYLVKWFDTSYCHLTWVPEEWIMRTSKQLFTRYCERVKNLRHAVEDDLIPKAWKTVQRILTAVDRCGSTIIKAPASRVDKILVKFNDLTYDEACWDTPPPEDSDLYSFFIDAYKQYLHACTVKPPTKMKQRVEEVRYAATRESYSQHEIKQQPNFIAGGTLLPHQLDGLNWLIYQWERSSPCILADDMGLGKTIQIVSFLNLLFKKFGVYPFLVIVPNSTATNWLREFNKWAPDMVVSTYFGSAKSRRLVRQHELFRGGEQDGIRAHAVILTYESATSDISIFGRTRFWPAMVVDEAQRLKNNESLLFKKLKSLQWDHTILMTGTPLQNNIRELMNLMHFVDPQKFADVEKLEAKYQELSRDVVQELHDQLKPYFLRRTKELVLKIPPKSEIIVPVSMTPLQKEVCKGLLEKNLISYAMLDNSEKGSSKTKKSLNNILMQLRKTLNHPYLIPGIELQQDTPDVTQRILIDASSKLKVLHQMLPKLLNGGHRILIFSTMQLTLDILEDYLNYEAIKYVRLDGTTPTIDRVKNIDAFNKTGSDINVFLLTTRAGGVGINLATADTVILWDFDPNPHQDQQAIGRAHRFGQTSPVLVLKFMTRFSVEEKIAQIAKKKLVLDHLVVNRMDDEDLEENDVESIIKFGTQALFDDDKSKDITYDTHAIDKLLDRSHISTTETSDQHEQTDENQKDFSFSFARVWNQDKEGATEELPEDAGTRQEENDFWTKFLQEKKKQYEEEQQKKEELGRGARKRGMISYREDLFYANNIKQPKKKKRKEASQSATELDGNGEDSTYVDVSNPGDEASDSEDTISASDLTELLETKKRNLPFDSQTTQQVPQQLQESQPSPQPQTQQQPPLKRPRGRPRLDKPRKQRAEKPKKQQSPQQQQFLMYSPQSLAQVQPPTAPNYLQWQRPHYPQPIQHLPHLVQLNPSRPPAQFNVPVSLPMRPYSMQPPSISQYRPHYHPSSQPSQSQSHPQTGLATQYQMPPQERSPSPMPPQERSSPQQPYRHENTAMGNAQLRETVNDAIQQPPPPPPPQQQYRYENTDARNAQLREALNFAIQQRLRTINQSTTPPDPQDLVIQQQALRMMQLGASGQYGARNAQEMLSVVEQLRANPNTHVPAQYINPTSLYLSTPNTASSASPIHSMATSTQSPSSSLANPQGNNPPSLANLQGNNPPQYTTIDPQRQQHPAHLNDSRSPDTSHQ